MVKEKTPSDGAEFAVLALFVFPRMVRAIRVVEEFQQIGGQLRSAREAAGLEVADVVFKTRIPRSVVEALEAEDFSSFTSPVYAKSFLAQYSGFLDVDAQPWLEALEPGSFMPGGPLRTLIEGPDPQGEEAPVRSEHRGGLLSVLVLLTCTAALVVAAIKGYDFFETRLGGEGFRPETMPRISPPGSRTATAPEVGATREMEDEAPAPPTPRAIIVR